MPLPVIKKVAVPYVTNRPLSKIPVAPSPLVAPIASTVHPMQSVGRAMPTQSTIPKSAMAQIALGRSSIVPPAAMTINPQVPRNLVKVGPIASQLIQMRLAGTPPATALAQVMQSLHASGQTVITPEIHAQLAAGLQSDAKIQSFASKGFGALGLSQEQGTGIKVASTASSLAVASGAAGASVLGGMAIGQTVIPIPVVGAVIGLVAYGLSLAFKQSLGKASKGWNSFYPLLQGHNGRDFDEHSWGEAFKGMMDEGNNIIGGCGADRHKDPDCFIVPLINQVQQGFLSGRVPLSATTSQVYQQIVLPWLQSGGGSTGVHWNVLQGEQIQQLMIMSAVDRYLAGLPVSRYDMPSYKGQGYPASDHIVPLAQVVAPLLAQAQTPTTATSTASTIPTSVSAQPVTITGTTSSGTPIVPVNETAALIAQMQAQGASQSQALAAAIASLQAQGINTSTPQVQQQLDSALQYPVSSTTPVTAVAPVTPVTAGAGGMGGTFAMIAGVVAVGFALARPKTRSARKK